MLRNLSLVLALAAGGVSGYLFYTTGIGGELPPGCGDGGGCGDVLGSRWSQWCGVSTSGLGVLAYLVLVAGILAARLWPAWGKTLHAPLLVVCGTGLLVILWFVCIQAFVLRAFCGYCMASHLLGGLSFLAMILAIRQAGPSVRTRRRVAAGALAGAAGFVALHLGFLPEAMVVEAAAEATVESGTPQPAATPGRREILLLKQQLRFFADEVPVLGSPDATHIVLELFDYTCKHCRTMHKVLHRLTETYPSEFAVAVLPYPLSRRCNPKVANYVAAHRDACVYARYSLGVLVADPSQFEAFHDYLMTGDTAPAVTAAQEEAERMVGAAPFQRALVDSRVPEWIRDGWTVMQGLRRTSIPILVTPDELIMFRSVDEEVVTAKLESMLGLVESPVEAVE